jgi:hypothetical protein
MAWSVSAASLVLVLADLSGAPTSDGGARAQALISQGVELRRQGKDDEALKVFEEAQRISPSPRGLGQLGLAEQATGRWAEADRDVNAALLQTDDSWVLKNQGVLQEALREIARHVGSVRLAGSPSGASVYINDKLVGALPLDQRVTAGELMVRVAAEGYVPLERRVVVEAGKKAAVLLDLPVARQGTTVSAAAPAAPPAAALVSQAPREGAPAAAPTPERAPLYERPAVWIIAGAVVVLGAVALALTAGRRDTYPTPSLGSQQY